MAMPIAMLLSSTTTFAQRSLEDLRASLEKEGFKKVRTSTIEGLKCEHYEDLREDGDVRVFYRENGDYFLCAEDEAGMNREPDLKCPSRLYLITHLSGVKETNRCFEFPDGNIIFYGNSKILWKSFKNQLYLKNAVDNSYFGWYQAVVLKNRISYTEDIRPDENSLLYLKGNTQKYPISSVPPICTQYYGQKGYILGYVMDDRLYQFNENGKMLPIAQKNGDYWMYANSSDTIVSVNVLKIGREGGPEEAEVIYKNGDKLKLNNRSIVSGKIHRNGGVLKIMNNGMKTVLTLPNGSIFDGDFEGSEKGNGGEETTILKYETLIPRDGTLQTSDGNIVQIMGGKISK